MSSSPVPCRPHYKEIGTAAGVGKPSESQKAKALWKVVVQLLPFAVFNRFVYRVAKCMPISVDQGWPPPVFRNVMVDIDARFLGSDFLCSQSQFFWTFSNKGIGALFFNLWPLNAKRLDALSQLTYFDCSSVINLNESPQAFHNPYPASFVEACDDTLDRRVTVCLLVRQQL